MVFTKFNCLQTKWNWDIFPIYVDSKQWTWGQCTLKLKLKITKILNLVLFENVFVNIEENNTMFKYGLLLGQYSVNWKEYFKDSGIITQATQLNQYIFDSW